MKTISRKYEGYSQEAIELLEMADATSFMESIVLYDRVIAMAPEPAFAYARRAFAKYQSGQISSSIADFDEAINKKPDAKNTIWQRAVAKLKLSDHEGAVTDFLRYLELKPMDPEALYWLGRTHEDIEQYQCALECYASVVEIASDYEDAAERIRQLNARS